ncbi:MAG: TonB-dependent receptor [Candidatus Thiodiazotropha sp. (ex Dulcina madagascariensis)]|nr:TonB-dependent receptor [Candidatus Thiodiazotropha sp. (ex Dulcina madagascariensis)]
MGMMLSKSRMIAKIKRGLFLSAIGLFAMTSLATAAEIEDKKTDILPDLSLEEQREIGPDFLPTLEQLWHIKFASSASLTTTTFRNPPAAITALDSTDIRSSGARSLNELLEIYVPNLQWIRHHFEASHLGMRGIISDREDKYLLLVNGRVMNERTHAGVLSERDLPILSDIHHIEIIRGPGSAVYGLGAISMVVNIVTYDVRTFQGFESTTRIGAWEEFYAQEFKYGRKFSEETGLFIYGGVSEYIGADQKYAPAKFSIPFKSKWDGFIPRDRDFPFDITNDRAQYRDKQPIKLHAQLMLGDWDFWARYTRGGETISSQFFSWRGEEAIDPQDPHPSVGIGYQQAAFAAKHTQVVSDEFSIDYLLGYDWIDYERVVPEPVRIDSHREDEYYAKAIAHWNPGKDHSIALGGEYSHEEFGLRSPGYPNKPASSIDPFRGVPMPRWSTNTHSLLFEHQWRLHDEWTTFLGGRIDKNKYSSNLFSPRFALIHTPTDKDTLKLMLSRSQRMVVAEELKAAAQAGNKRGTPEVLDSLELRWERQHTQTFGLAGSVYYHDLDAIGFDFKQVRSQLVGNQKQWGLELEATYKKDNLRIDVSHGYTKLIDFDLIPGAGTIITASPVGFGDDLASWSNHITKLVTKYDISDQWSLNGALQYYWGFEGTKDAMEFDSTRRPLPFSSSTIYGPNAYMHLGLEYGPSENLTVAITGYNLLGLIDEDLNKRNYIFGRYSYRIQAPALGVTLQIKF